MEQENLLGLVADKVLRKLFFIGEHLGVIGKIRADDFLLERCVTALFGVGVNAGEIPIPGVERDRCNTVAARDEKSFRFTAGLQIAAGVQIRMAKIAELLVVLGEQYPGNRLS